MFSPPDYSKTDDLEICNHLLPASSSSCWLTVDIKVSEIVLRNIYISLLHPSQSAGRLVDLAGPLHLTSKTMVCHPPSLHQYSSDFKRCFPRQIILILKILKYVGISLHLPGLLVKYQYSTPPQHLWTFCFKVSMQVLSCLVCSTCPRPQIRDWLLCFVLTNSSQHVNPSKLNNYSAPCWSLLCSRLK